MLWPHRIEEHLAIRCAPRSWSTRLRISSGRRVDVGGQPLLPDGVPFRQDSAADLLEGAVVAPAKEAAPAGLEGTQGWGKPCPRLFGAGDVDDGFQDLPFAAGAAPGVRP